MVLLLGFLRILSIIFFFIGEIATSPTVTVPIPFNVNSEGPHALSIKKQLINSNRITTQIG